MQPVSDLMHTARADRLKALLDRPEDEIDLAEAALLVATDEYPALDIEAYLRRLDELAEGVRRRLQPEADFETTVVALNEFLFDEQGFCGNTEDYYDPRNSFLNEVLDRRRGIPVTLAILYIEIGRRLGLALEGVTFPGHFLVKTATAEGEVVLDPFSGGMPVSEEDLRERLQARFPEHDAPLGALARLLAAADKKQILLRMLRNLKAIYLHREQHDKALGVLNRMLSIDPVLPEELRERGEVYMRLECFRAALQDFRRYLDLNPAAAEAALLHRRISDLERLAARLN
ncbi:SirB1 family protein [Sulfurifustis variabilis]|nr:tetratricopeptide repeat protein [Sulfurifustis variabilis]